MRKVPSNGLPADPTDQSALAGPHGSRDGGDAVVDSAAPPPELYGARPGDTAVVEVRPQPPVAQQDELAALGSRQVAEAETEIGRLLLRTQAFVDATVADTNERARRVINAAEVEAAETLADARRQAHDILAGATRASADRVETAAELQATIDGFLHANNQLVNELSLLRAQPAQPAPAAPADGR